MTPDAFVVSDALLGMPLAAPGRRLVAILVDLLVIGILTAVTKSFALVLGVVIAVLLVRAGFRRVSVPANAFSRAMRGAVGCLGVFIGFITLVLWVAFGVDMAVSDRMEVSAPGVPAGALDVATAAAGATAGLEFASAPDLASAEVAGARLVTMGRDIGLAPDEIRGLLEGLAPTDASWSEEADLLVDRLVTAPSGTDLGAAGVRPDPAQADQSGFGGIVGQETASNPSVTEQDSLSLLQAEVETLVAEVRRAREEAAEAEAARSEGSLAWLRSVLDELGFGFGWATLYMTVILSWWKGQTVGKRLLGIRVVRLDGEPITWWTAFERAGGYAAGFATGLLGFAQVYWDANRQAIHDRIVGTVVVREGAPKILDWESTL